MTGQSPLAVDETLPPGGGLGANHRVLESVTPFEGSFFKVVVDTISLPGGQTARREIVRHSGASAVVALQDGAVLLVRQNRHAAGLDLLEIPAGKLDVPGEDPATCALRELREETGYTASRRRPLGAFYTSPGFTDECVHLFVATLLTQARGPPPATDEGEPITSEWMPMDEAIAAATSGRIADAKTALGLALARLSGETGASS